jgi:hypothetical protein
MVQQEAGEATSVVADYGVFFEEIVLDHAETQLLQGCEIDDYRVGALRAVAAGD